MLYAIFTMNISGAWPHPYVGRSPSVYYTRAVLMAMELGARFYAVRAAILVGALILSLVVFRAWCRYPCPLGAILGLFNKVSLWRIRRSEPRCSGCGMYPRECLQDTVPETTDCIVCGDCVQGCARGAMTVRAGWGGAERPSEA